MSSSLPECYVTGLFWTQLLNWHLDNERLFPWRNTRNPYHILVAEVLLQQTRAEAALYAYTRFIEQFPCIVDLAQAELQDVSDVVRPIGLTYRVSPLKACASRIIDSHSGQVPSSREDLLELPGIGSYIADAVLCYAFNQPTVPVDTNVVRVMSRFFGLTSNRSEARKDRMLIERIASCYPVPVSKQDNLAVLDFAALICTARTPRCAICPVLCMCAYHRAQS